MSKSRRSAGSQTPSARPRRVWLVAVAGLLLLCFMLWATGGVHWLLHLNVRQALGAGQDELAEQRLSLISWLGETPETTYLKARLARHRAQYGVMLELLDQAHRAGYSPESLQLETLLAAAESGQLDEQARSQLNDWLLRPEIDAREISAAYANGLTFIGSFSEANQVLNAWSADFPEDARPLYRQGRIAEHQRDKAKALEKYQAALARDPSSVPIIFALGRLLLDQRQASEALQVLQRCPESDRNIPVQVVMGMCYKSLAELEQARQIFQRVLTHETAEIEAAYRQVNEPCERLIAAAELGKLESDDGNFAEARRYLERAIEFNPRDMEARYAYAVALRGLGEMDKAEAEFAYVKTTTAALSSVNVYWDRISSNPADVEARLELAKILLEHESVRNGLFWLRSIQPYDPDNAQVKELLERYAQTNSTP